MLEEYALIPLVERAIEMVHAIVKRVGHDSPNVSLPQVSALVNLPRNLRLLKEDRTFYELCKSLWQSRTLFTKLLAYRFTADEIRQMRPLEKIRHVYQCNLDDEFSSTEISNQHRSQ